MREFHRRFEAELGEIGCRDLTGLDLSTEEALTLLEESDIAR